jgi:hypothetical protein
VKINLKLGLINMQIECKNLDSLVVNKLPDGSRVIVDSGSETVYALNATAGAAWDACSEPTTLPKVAASMQRTLDVDVTEEMADMAIRQLAEKKLVAMPGAPLQTRRQVFGTLSAAVALPLVVALSMSDQRAYARAAVSPPPKQPTPPGHQPPPPRFPWF